MYKISDLGKRIGYLYDIASPEDKKAIDEIIHKYSSEYPLIYTGKNMRLAETPKEAKKLQLLFDNYKKD